MNIHIPHPTHAEQESFENNHHFEHPTLTLAQRLMRLPFVKIEIAGVLIGLVGLMALLKVGLEIYQLLIDPFSFPNLDLPLSR